MAADALSSLEGEFRGQLHLGVVSPAHYFAPSIISAFKVRFPGVRVRITVAKRDQLLSMLAEHKIDLILAGYPSAQTEVEAETFARNPHCLVASADHPLAGRRGLTWQDLRGEPFIFREDGSSTRQFFEHLLQTQGLQVNVDLELDGNETVKQAVMASGGIAFLSAHVFQHELESGKLSVLDVEGMPKWLDWCVLTRREQAVPAIRQAFREFVLAEGARYAACSLSQATVPDRQRAAIAPPTLVVSNTGKSEVQRDQSAVIAVANAPSQRIRSTAGLKDRGDVHRVSIQAPRAVPSSGSRLT